MIPSHGHVITLHHVGFYSSVARCRCRSFRWGLNDDVLGWIVQHRRHVFPRFRG